MTDHFLKLEARILELKTGKNCEEFWWMGDVGGVYPAQLPVHISEQIKYTPTQEDFLPLKRRQAAEVLAWVISESLCFGVKTGKPKLIEELVWRFQALGPDMRFWSNGTPPKRILSADGKKKAWIHGSRPLAKNGMTLDTGLICSDGSTGFIYWAEDID